MQKIVIKIKYIVLVVYSSKKIIKIKGITWQKSINKISYQILRKWKKITNNYFFYLFLFIKELEKENN
jgi:hypothetical protein